MNQEELKEYMNDLYFEVKDTIKDRDLMYKKCREIISDNEKLENLICDLFDEILTMSSNYNIDIHDGDTNYNYYRKVFNEIQKQKEEIINE